MLEISGLTIRYGAFLAVDGLDIVIGKGEIVGLIGPNGAGKTSTVKALGGLIRPAAGRIAFRGRDLAGVPAHERITLGLSIVPEGRGIFARMSVEENLLMGAYAFDGADKAARMRRVYDLFPILAERRWQAAGTMSGGQQQMLAVSMGLMAEPEMIVLDEPSLGLAPIVIEEIGKALIRLREAGVTVFLVEQNATLTADVSDRIYVMSNGTVLHHGTAEEITRNEDMLGALL
jgi:branched-chain amino acid transport system ATP-binding protein